MSAIDGVLDRIVTSAGAGATRRGERLGIGISAVCPVRNVESIRPIAGEDIDAIEVVVLGLDQQIVQVGQVCDIVADRDPEVTFFTKAAWANALDVIDVNGIRSA